MEDRRDIDDRLLEILACPVCEEHPSVEKRDDELVCVKCGRVYPVKDGIPVMLADRARTEE